MGIRGFGAGSCGEELILSPGENATERLLSLYLDSRSAFVFSYTPSASYLLQSNLSTSSTASVSSFSPRTSFFPVTLFEPFVTAFRFIIVRPVSTYLVGLIHPTTLLYFIFSAYTSIHKGVQVNH